jgi:hypothetical protein
LDANLPFAGVCVRLVYDSFFVVDVGGGGGGETLGGLSGGAGRWLLFASLFFCGGGFTIFIAGFSFSGIGYSFGK